MTMPDNEAVLLTAVYGLEGARQQGDEFTTTDIAIAAQAELKRIAEIAGSFTLSPTESGWIDKEGEYIEEPGFKVEVLITGISPSGQVICPAEEKVMELLRAIGIVFNQQTIVIWRMQLQADCLPLSPAAGFRLT